MTSTKCTEGKEVIGWMTNEADPPPDMLWSVNNADRRLKPHQRRGLIPAYIKLTATDLPGHKA